MDNVQKHSIYINVSSSQTFRSCLKINLCHTHPKDQFTSPVLWILHFICTAYTGVPVWKLYWGRREKSHGGWRSRHLSLTPLCLLLYSPQTYSGQQLSSLSKMMRTFLWNRIARWLEGKRGNTEGGGGERNSSNWRLSIQWASFCCLR
jgi:hypothetical protein